MPVSALPAMRAVIAYSAPAAGGSWADYANTVLDSLFAADFRGAPSLAGSIFYGSTPSIVQQPGGGLVLGANGLECAADTMLNTSILPDSADYCIGVLVYSANANNMIAAGAYDSTAPGDLYVGYANASNKYFGYGSGGTANVADTAMPATMMHIGARRYVDGSYKSTSAGTWNDFSTYPLYIGARGRATPDQKWNGIISTVFIGILKAGADADTVASELHTRMQTAAL